MYINISLYKIENISFQNDVGTTALESHFQQVIERAPLALAHAPAFIARLAKYFLPHATLWSGLMLGRFYESFLKLLLMITIYIILSM